jgi:hydroxyacyl-ACP dehydratase HTD2-like protein with hotdog domain
LVSDRRFLTTSASKAAEQMMQAFANKEFAKRQLLDANQLQKLSLTLSRKELYPGMDISEDPPPAGTPLPPGYHLVYFSPGGMETELGPDGTDRTFNSPAPFTRRMWAGGKMTWAGGKSQLRVGEVAEERTRLVSAVPKKSRGGGEMVLVDVEKEFWGKDGLALVDQR